MTDPRSQPSSSFSSSTNNISSPQIHPSSSAYPPDLEKQDIEKPESTFFDDDTSSVFSERHMEGPLSARRVNSSLSRTTSRRLERAQTSASVALSAIRSRAPRERFAHPLEHSKTSPEVLVDFDGPDDPYRPLNWSMKKKVVTTILYGMTSLTTTFSSSIFSTGQAQIAGEYGVGAEVATLGTALFLLGLGLGPLLWAPLSELYGRKTAVLIPTFIGCMFTFGVGGAGNIQTIIICRFFSGFFCAAPVTNTGGVLGDIWTPQQRGSAMVLYSISVVGGPTVGPLIGGAISMSYLGWRWTMFITGIMTMTILVLDVLLTDESYAPVLLKRKAQALRLESGNWALHAKHEEWNPSLVDMGNKYLIVPFRLLTTPICFMLASYSSFCYGILYGSLGALPYVFQDLRGWNQVVGALPFLSMLVGILIGACTNFINQKYYLRAMQANNNRPVPEARLPPMMFGSVVFTAGLFMFAWTSTPSVHWIVPVIAIALQGFGFYTIFQGALNYLIDTFQRYAASAVAANTFLRSCFACAFPLFITQELKGLGVGWGVSVFAFVSVIMLPIPYLFYTYGKRIRASNAWSRDSTL